MKFQNQLDTVSRRILAILQEDATISHIELAEGVGASSHFALELVKYTTAIPV